MTVLAYRKGAPVRQWRGTTVAMPGALVVGVVDSSDAVSDQSIAGPQVGVPAFGTDVLTTYFAAGDCALAPTGGATSWATGYVAGAAALLAQAYPQETSVQLAYRLEVTRRRASTSAPTGIRLRRRRPPAAGGYWAAQVSSASRCWGRGRGGAGRSVLPRLLPDLLHHSRSRRVAERRPGGGEAGMQRQVRHLVLGHPPHREPLRSAGVDA